MVIRYRDILELIQVLSEEKNVQVTVSGSLKGGLITGSMATVCGVILGPVGLAIGGAVGGFVATYVFQNKFMPLAQVVVEMREHDQRRLVSSVQNILSNLDAGDAMQLIAIVQGNELLKAQVMNEMFTFLRTQMNYHVMDGF